MYLGVNPAFSIPSIPGFPLAITDGGTGSSTVDAALKAIGANINDIVLCSSNTVLNTSHRGKLIIATANSFTISLPELSTVGTGFSLSIKNIGSGTISVDPFGAELIDANATLSLSQNQSCIVTSSIIPGNTGWFSVGLNNVATGGLLRILRLTTAGSNTYIKPSSVKNILIKAQGGGGGGGGHLGAGLTGGGGGSGGYCELWISNASASYNYTIGAGGTSSQVDFYGRGGAGGNTTIAGMTAGGGGGALSSYYSSPWGGGGGSATGGDINVWGERGFDDGRGGTSQFGRGGHPGVSGQIIGLRGGGGAGGFDTNTGGVGYIEIFEYA